MKTIKSFFARIISFFKSDALEKRLAQAYDVLAVVLPIVEAIAALTPTRADDEILALAQRYLLPLPSGPLSDAEKTGFLRDTALSVARRELNQAGVPDSVIGLAVELAVNVVKAVAK